MQKIMLSTLAIVYYWISRDVFHVLAKYANAAWNLKYANGRQIVTIYKAQEFRSLRTNH